MSTSDVMTRYDVHFESSHEQPVAVVKATLGVAEIPAWIGGAFGEVAALLSAQHHGPAGPAFARYHREDDGRFTIEAGFPTVGPLTPAGRVEAAVLPAGPVAVTTHVGPYDAMVPAYTAVREWVAAAGGVPSGDPWEVYYSDPREDDPATWTTDVVQPFRTAG